MEEEGGVRWGGGKVGGGLMKGRGRIREYYAVGDKRRCVNEKEI